jgi:hypothetical protein
MEQEPLVISPQSPKTSTFRFTAELQFRRVVNDENRCSIYASPHCSLEVRRQNRRWSDRFVFDEPVGRSQFGRARGSVIEALFGCHAASVHDLHQSRGKPSISQLGAFKFSPRAAA